MKIETQTVEDIKLLKAIAKALFKMCYPYILIVTVFIVHWIVLSRLLDIAIS